MDPRVIGPLTDALNWSGSIVDQSKACCRSTTGQKTDWQQTRVAVLVLVDTMQTVDVNALNGLWLKAHTEK